MNKNNECDLYGNFKDCLKLHSSRTVETEDFDGSINIDEEFESYFINDWKQHHQPRK